MVHRHTYRQNTYAHEIKTFLTEREKTSGFAAVGFLILEEMARQNLEIEFIL